MDKIVIYRIKHKNGYVYKICNHGLHVTLSKTGKVWFNESVAKKSLDWCRNYNFPLPRDQDYKLESYELLPLNKIKS